MKSLLLKMILYFGLIVCVICVICSVFSVITSSENLLEVEEKIGLELRNAYILTISDSMIAEENLLRSIARQTELTDNAFSIKQKLDSLQPDLEDSRAMGFLHFGLIQPNGMMYSTDGTNTDVSLEPYFTMTMKGEAFVSDPFFTRSGEFIQISTVPLLVNNRSVGGLVLMKDGFFLSGIVDRINLGETGSGALFSLETGQTIAVPLRDRQNIESGMNIIEDVKINPDLKGLETIILNLMNGEVGIETFTCYLKHNHTLTAHEKEAGIAACYTPDGVDKMVFYAPIPGMNWGLILFQEMDEILASSNESRNVMIFFTIILFIISLLLTFFIARNISLPIKYATEQIQYLTEGDLSFKNKLQLYQRKKDEIGTIARSIQTLQKNISHIFRDILNVAQQVADGSKEISTSSQSLSSVASEQAAATEEVSATMEEMSTTVKQNADSAIKTGSVSKQAVENVYVGKDAVDGALEAVKKIASEISIIDGIASQTNLLALNAAIEAARAGEAGKGFAVVAGEIRKLAEKSQVAATEINMLSAKTITAAERAGEVISSAIPGIEQTADLIGEISSVCIEQSSQVEQVNKAIIPINAGTQENTSSSEELAAMATNMSDQSAILTELLKFFKLSDDDNDGEVSPP